ncbi:DUF2065 domain-containing protein [Aestuariibacter halophilus]|uniref:DUF2065 domain-containing protein n=1 Tax=Fluctibacter halophilus TaxID=226011 RepID=A0ABS8GAW5_9ALTE|nr:DUF2065 domain-containing protein [Aestuariibacter halophilus]MCC2617211.1 DUF2065 domain-containing protein [Aestuariibacter halophilus]
MQHSLWLALALVLIIEGLGPLLFPRRWQHFMAELARQDAHSLRTLGGVLVTVGVVSLYFLL